MLLAEGVEDAVYYSFKAAEMLELGGGADLEEVAEEFLKIAYQHRDFAPWPARSRLRAAAIYERLERYDAAERQYRVVAERYPDTEEGLTAAERLRVLRARQETVLEEQIITPEPQQD
jgi:hypothetical protein